MLLLTGVVEALTVTETLLMRGFGLLKWSASARVGCRSGFGQRGSIVAVVVGVTFDRGGGQAKPGTLRIFLCFYYFILL